MTKIIMVMIIIKLMK